MIRGPKLRPVVIRGIASIGGAAAAAAMPLAAAAEGTGALPGAGIARVVIGSVIVIGLLFATVKLIPRIGGASNVDASSFRVVASLPIGQRERVVIVQVGQQQILLGVAPGHVGRLHELEAPLAEKSGNAAGRTQAPAQLWLERIIGRRA